MIARMGLVLLAELAVEDTLADTFWRIVSRRQVLKFGAPDKGVS